MADIIQKIGEWTGKVIIPHDDALKQKITIYSTRKMPRSKALSMIYTALFNKGFIVEQIDGVIYLKPIKDAKLTSVPTVSAEEPLAAIDNKDMIVQKFFRLKSYSPSRLQELILPLIAEYGYISADETTRSLVIIDTVGNLIRIERIITQLDVSQAGPTITKVFEIHQGDPVEIVQLLRILVGDGSLKPGSGNKSGNPSSPPKPSDRPSPGGGKSNGPATSVVISARNAPIVLIPEPKRQWIIAKASPDDMAQIGEWIEKLDKKEPVDTKHTIIKIQHVDVRELSQHINNTMQQMPGHELRSNVMVLPLEKTRTLMVFGSEDNRQIVEKLIEEIDIPPDTFETRHFKLKFALPEQIKKYIEELHTTYGTESSSYRSYDYSYSRQSRRSDTGQDMVRVIAYPELQQVTVITSPAKMEKIAEDVAKWDRPYDYEKYESRDFPLDHAAPDQIKTYIEELYTDNADSGFNPYSYYSYRYQSRNNSQEDDDKVRVISYSSLQQVTVIASPRNLEKIAKQIAEWDQPLEVNKVKPMIVELHNSDPVKMAKLLSTLFSEDKSNSNDPFRFIFGFRGGNDESQKQIVGPLYGQLSFEPVPDTKKIIVISKIPEAYDVVGQLIEELDRQEAAELPTVVTLKYADPEDLCERLNALLNETGTIATIHLAKRELSSYAPGAASDEQNDTSRPNTEDSRNTSPGEYKPWWTSARRRPDEELPISNVIGQIRFIPDHRSKAIMVLCSPEYTESVKQMIEELDQPAQQVMVKAVILAINHEKMTSLGLQLANSPSIFGALSENALTALAGLSYAETFGSVNFESTMDIAGLVDFLVKTTDAKILNQPTLWAKDNEEATFFRGQTVPFIANSRESAEGSTFTQNFEEKEVGVTLRVRPNITPEKAVDMNINIIVSQVEPDLLAADIVRSEVNTTTHMIIPDAGTILLSGILFQQDVTIERKIPLLGDIPLLGGLFRHNDIQKTNNEILIFITPYVTEGDTYGSAAEEIEQSTKKMETIKKNLQDAVESEKN